MYPRPFQHRMAALLCSLASSNRFEARVLYLENSYIIIIVNICLCRVRGKIKFMKTLQDGSFAFYESKKKKFIIFAGSALFLFAVLYFVPHNPNKADDSVAVFALGLVISILFVQFAVSFFQGPLVVINETYIKLKGLPEVVWDNVAYVTLEKRWTVASKHRRWTITITVVDPSIYPLSLMQKIKTKFGISPFMLNVNMFDAQERELLRQQLCAFRQFKNFEESSGLF